MDFEHIDYSEMDGDEIYDYGCDFLDGGDVDNALKCFILAAEKDDVSAQSQLGDMYRYGKWVEANFEEAVKWYKLAAENGDRGAIYYLGYLYYYGDDVEQDYKEAYYWFSKDDFYDIPIYADYAYGLYPLVNMWGNVYYLYETYKEITNNTDENLDFKVVFYGLINEIMFIPESGIDFPPWYQLWMKRLKNCK